MPKVGRGSRILRPLRNVLRITVVKRKFKVNCSNIQLSCVIIKKYLSQKLFLMKGIVRIMFRNILIILPLLQNRRYSRRSQRLTMTSVETLT